MPLVLFTRGNLPKGWAVAVASGCSEGVITVVVAAVVVVDESTEAVETVAVDAAVAVTVETVALAMVAALAAAAGDDELGEVAFFCEAAVFNPLNVLAEDSFDPSARLEEEEFFLPEF